jgi:hypothetical protein
VSHSRPTDHNAGEPQPAAGARRGLRLRRERIGESELRASFRAGWKVVSLEADRLETTFDPEGIPAWLAKIERA